MLDKITKEFIEKNTDKITKAALCIEDTAEPEIMLIAISCYLTRLCMMHNISAYDYLAAIAHIVIEVEKITEKENANAN